MTTSRAKTHTIAPPPNGSMEYARGFLADFAATHPGGSEPSEDALREVAELLHALNRAGVGSGRKVTIHFTGQTGATE